MAQLSAGPGLAQLPIPPQFLMALPALAGLLKWAAQHLPEQLLVETIRSTRDMCDGWLEAADHGQPDRDANTAGDGAGDL